MQRAEGIGDNSAPRETNRLLRMANELTEVHTNVQLMISNKCTPPRAPLTYAVYMIGNGLPSRADEGGPKPAACEFKDWKRTQ